MHYSEIKVILNGTKINGLFFRNIVVKDSSMFISTKLENFPKCFGISELKKGYFPHTVIPDLLFLGLNHIFSCLPMGQIIFTTISGTFCSPCLKSIFITSKCRKSSFSFSKHKKNNGILNNKIIHALVTPSSIIILQIKTKNTSYKPVRL